MYKLFFKTAFICFSVLGICALDAGGRTDAEVSGYLSLEYNFNEKLLLPLQEADFNRFQLIHKASVSGSYVHEWIPTGQDLTNWKEMVTIMFNRRVVPNASDLEKVMKETSKMTYRDSEYHFTTVYKDRSDLIYILEVPNGHQTFPPYTSVMRHVITSKGVHSVSYERQHELLNDAEKELWVEKLKHASLEPKI